MVREMCKMSLVKKVCWLGLYIAAATADVVLAVEKNILHRS